MRARDRDSWEHVKVRRLMRARRRIETAGHGLVGLLQRRMAEAEYNALRFRYRLPSSWDCVFNWRS